MAIPWLRRLVAGLSPRRPEFDPVSVNVGFVVDQVALGQDFPRILRFSPVNFIPPCSITRQNEKTIVFITELHNKPQSCGASLASAAGPFTKKKKERTHYFDSMTWIPQWRQCLGTLWLVGKPLSLSAYQNKLCGAHITPNPNGAEVKVVGTCI
jgi:hypothetical protein